MRLLALGENYEQVVFNLIGNAQRTNWLHELIVAAKTENPTGIRRIAAELQPMINAATRDHFNVTFVDNNSVLVNRTFLRALLNNWPKPNYRRSHPRG